MLYSLNSKLNRLLHYQPVIDEIEKQFASSKAIKSCSDVSHYNNPPTRYGLVNIGYDFDDGSIRFTLHGGNHFKENVTVSFTRLFTYIDDWTTEYSRLYPHNKTFVTGFYSKDEKLIPLKESVSEIVNRIEELLEKYFAEK